MNLLLQCIRAYKFNSLFIKVFCSFILLMFLSIVSVGYLSYSNSSNLLIEEVKNANMALLKQAKNSIDELVITLEKISS